MWRWVRGLSAARPRWRRWAVIAALGTLVTLGICISHSHRVMPDHRFTDHEGFVADELDEIGQASIEFI